MSFLCTLFLLHAFFMLRYSQTCRMRTAGPVGFLCVCVFIQLMGSSNLCVPPHGFWAETNMLVVRLLRNPTGAHQRGKRQMKRTRRGGRGGGEERKQGDRWMDHNSGNSVMFVCIKNSNPPPPPILLLSLNTKC